MSNTLIPLSEFLSNLESGKRPTGGAVDAGIPSLGGEHINADGSIKLEPMKFVPDDFFRTIRKGLIKKNDILVVKDGATTGRTGFVDESFPFEEAATNEHLFLLRANPKKALPKFLYYLLRSRRGNSQILQDFRGAAQGGISRGFIEKVFVPNYTLDDQEKIVYVLSHAEKIISLRKKSYLINQKLIASIFSKMFGDVASNSKNWNSLLLPDVLKDSFKNGLYLGKEFYVDDGSEDGIEMVHMSDAFYGEVERGNLKRLRLTPKQLSDYSLTSNSLLVARRSLTYEGAAKIASIPESDHPLVFESSFIRLNPNNELIRSEFLLHYLNNDQVRKAHIEKRINGITIFGINQESLSQVPILAPPLSLQDEFVMAINQIKKIRLHQDESLNQSVLSFNSLLDRYFLT